MNLFPCVRQPSARGFTLLEMLAALAVTGIVSGLSLISLRAIMGASEDAADRSTALVELNRGLDFISTEVKASSSLTVPPSCPPTLPAGAPACFQAVLEINAPAAVASSPIYYYLADAQVDEEIGPQVIYRQGPSFDASGDYDPATTVTAALIDGLAMGDATRPCLLAGANIAGNSEFYVCSNLDVAEIHLRSPEGTEVNSTAYFHVQ